MRILLIILFVVLVIIMTFDYTIEQVTKARYYVPKKVYIQKVYLKRLLTQIKLR